MKSRKSVVLALLACGIVAGLIRWVPRQSEPVYQGKTLTQWMDTYNSPANPTAYNLYPQRTERLLPDSFYATGAPGIGTQEAAEMDRRRREAEDALRRIGTNAIPTLLKWEDKDGQVAWKWRLFAALPRGVQERRLVDWWLIAADNYRIARALIGFHMLGSNAIPAVPELTQRMMTRTSKSGMYAATALANMGAAGLPALLCAVTNTQTPNRRWVVRMAGNATMAASNDISGVLVLAQCVRDADAGVAEQAAMNLGWVAREPGIILPALVAGLADPRGQIRARSADALGHFGRRARPAVPALLRYLNDPDAFVRDRVTNALQQLAPEVLQTNSPPRGGL